MKVMGKREEHVFCIRLCVFCHSLSRIPEVCIKILQEEFEQLDCTVQQKDRMKEFFQSKQDVGELRQDDLLNICELGVGNGGVVWKVRHKPTDKIMARKVFSSFNPFLPHPKCRSREREKGSIACFACFRTLLI